MKNLSDLWQRYKRHSDPEARQELILAYAYLAKYVVDRMLIRPNSVLGSDDLLGHAILGLMDAVEKFDTTRDVKFETYAVIRIRGAVLDAVKSLDRVPRSVRAQELKIREAFAELEAKLGRPPTDDEVAARVGIGVDALNNALGEIGQSAMISLEEMVCSGDDGWSSPAMSVQPSPENDPVLAIELKERKSLLTGAIDGLPEKEKLVVSLYYKEGLTLKEIAAVLGVTESRACQLHSKAVIRLRGKLARHADLLLAAA